MYAQWLRTRIRWVNLVFRLAQSSQGEDLGGEVTDTGVSVLTKEALAEDGAEETEEAADTEEADDAEETEEAAE